MIKQILLGALLLTGVAFADAPKFGTTVEGKVFQVEGDAVYVTAADTTAIKAPLYATFMVNGVPVAPSALKNGDAVVVVYPQDAVEIIAGPLPPSDNSPYYHRSIKRGADVVDQDFRDNMWRDR